MTEFAPGMTASFSKTISEYDVYGFAGISGDLNRVHIDAEYAKGTVFGSRIAHGALLLSFVSATLGMRLPGPGTVLLGMSAEFVKAGYIGDTVTVEVRIREVQGNRLVLDFTCSNQDQQALVTGDARVSVPRRRPEAGA